MRPAEKGDVIEHVDAELERIRGELIQLVDEAEALKALRETALVAAGDNGASHLSPEALRRHIDVQPEVERARLLGLIDRLKTPTEEKHHDYRSL